MLQFITHPSEKYSIVDEIKMVIEGGCRWVQLRMKDCSDEEIKEVVDMISPLCKETETILVVDDRVELVKKLAVSGVHIGKEDMPPSEAREYLGAEPIIGVTANTAADIIAMRGLDIDYVGLGPFKYTTTKKRLSPVLGIEGYISVITDIREAGILLPIVAIGGITLEDVPSLMATGINGIAVSSSIINADDPISYTRQLIDCLTMHHF